MGTAGPVSETPYFANLSVQPPAIRQLNVLHRDNELYCGETLDLTDLDQILLILFFDLDEVPVENAGVTTVITALKADMAAFNAKESVRLALFNAEYMFCCDELDLGTSMPTFGSHSMICALRARFCF